MRITTARTSIPHLWIFTRVDVFDAAPRRRPVVRTAMVSIGAAALARVRRLVLADVRREIVARYAGQAVESV